MNKGGCRGTRATVASIVEGVAVTLLSGRLPQTVAEAVSMRRRRRGTTRSPVGARIISLVDSVEYDGERHENAKRSQRDQTQLPLPRFFVEVLQQAQAHQETYVTTTCGKIR
jgi:hypothetical protein